MLFLVAISHRACFADAEQRFSATDAYSARGQDEELVCGQHTTAPVGVVRRCRDAETNVTLHSRPLVQHTSCRVSVSASPGKPPAGRTDRVRDDLSQLAEIESARCRGEGLLCLTEVFFLFSSSFDPRKSPDKAVALPTTDYYYDLTC